jgi:predicted chitinase
MRFTDLKETVNHDVFNPAFNDTQFFNGLTYRATGEEDHQGKPYFVVKVFDDNFERVGLVKFALQKDKAGNEWLESLISAIKPEYQGKGIASHVYAYARMLGNTVKPSNDQTAQGRAMWSAWSKSGDAKHLTSNESKFSDYERAVMEGGHSLEKSQQSALRQAVTNENFADGKNPEHKGDSKRHGIPKHATLSQLDKISHEGGRRGQLAHWQANMRRGRAKNESEILDDLEEGWKDWVAGAALGAAALSPQSADAKVNPQPKPAITQQSNQTDVAAITRTLLKPEAKILVQTARAAGLRGKELAQFVAQCAHETANFSSLKELGGRLDFKKYDPKFNPRKAKMLGNKQVGDGAKYHGRGYIQLTGRDNYKRAGLALGLPLEEQPELVERPDIAAKVAVWFWQNQVAPRVSNFGDTAQVTKPINSGLKGLDDRHNKFASIMALMGSKS